MLIFRSEDHVANWLGGRQAGATIPIRVLADLATAWWGNRLAPDWHPRTREENQVILDGLGLTGPFWSLG